MNPEPPNATPLLRKPETEEGQEGGQADEAAQGQEGKEDHEDHAEAVISLQEHLLEPIPEVIAVLEEALEGAKSGKLRSVAVASETLGGQTSTAFSMGDGDRAHLVYALECLKVRLIWDNRFLEEG